MFCLQSRKRPGTRGTSSKHDSAWLTYFHSFPSLSRGCFLGAWALDTHIGRVSDSAYFLNKGIVALVLQSFHVSAGSIRVTQQVHFSLMTRKRATISRHTSHGQRRKKRPCLALACERIFLVCTINSIVTTFPRYTRPTLILMETGCRLATEILKCCRRYGWESRRVLSNFYFDSVGQIPERFIPPTHFHPEI